MATTNVTTTITHIGRELSTDAAKRERDVRVSERKRGGGRRKNT